ncbi:hypothetical protein BU16DRAFT_554035 [Lophium mytilinum]|uniref:Uncharacterized protein n=1 Tax=Lophium mytilinum TaxID=390894 RepID=A0A6A6RC82_9PEZI|nr:hypothetical protein BU16DRAFT_554035 [Lophium mytilinum]
MNLLTFRQLKHEHIKRFETPFTNAEASSQSPQLTTMVSKSCLPTLPSLRPTPDNITQSRDGRNDPCRASSESISKSRKRTTRASASTAAPTPYAPSCSPSTGAATPHAQSSRLHLGMLALGSLGIKTRRRCDEVRDPGRHGLGVESDAAGLAVSYGVYTDVRFMTLPGWSRYRESHRRSRRRWQGGTPCSRRNWSGGGGKSGRFRSSNTRTGRTLS